MEIDRETVYQLVLAGGVVGLFIAGAVFVGTTYGTDGNLTSEGGMVLVAAIGGFILLMVGAGLILERQDFEQAADSEADQESNT